MVLSISLPALRAQASHIATFRAGRHATELTDRRTRLRTMSAAPDHAPGPDPAPGDGPAARLMPGAGTAGKPAGRGQSSAPAPTSSWYRTRGACCCCRRSGRTRRDQFARRMLGTGAAPRDPAARPGADRLPAARWRRDGHTGRARCGVIASALARLGSRTRREGRGVRRGRGHGIAFDTVLLDTVLPSDTVPPSDAPDDEADGVVLALARYWRWPRTRWPRACSGWPRWPSRCRARPSRCSATRTTRG